ncbi:phenylalanine--tRNA ligase alpha subunit, cytoplasmic [Tanacetum coccineum]
MAQEAILTYLDKKKVILDSGEFAVEAGLGHEEVINTIKSLKNSKHVDTQDIKKESCHLTAEGETYAANGSPEYQLFMAIPPEGITIVELQKKLGDSIFKIGRQHANKNKWVEMGKSQASRKVEHIDDNVKDMLVRIKNGEALNQEDFDALKRRKLISLQLWKGYSVKKGPDYALKRTKLTTDLTREHMQCGNLDGLELKDYNYLAKGKETDADDLSSDGRRFEEMPTYNYVESSFWNFDALFQPQQHPARDSHDTFFLKEPSTTRTLPEDYVARVKQIHESGGHGSKGYRYDWKREESNKNLLRTHTTAVSSRMLYALAKKPFVAKKYYSIDRVFRNEAVDRTHLAEFHQIEGLICDRGLNLGDLQGVLHDFFSRLGMTKLRFKPAYNPYTEPSMEIFGYHEGFKKWVEVGNSGMFRPEMLLPMGLPEDVRVIAWGLSLERPTMILYGIDNIRDLFGHKVELGLIKSNPICKIGLQYQPHDEDPSLPADLKGETFCALLGTHTSALELFLIQRKIKGPSWLSISKFTNCSTAERVSWCTFEVTIDCSKDIKVPTNPENTREIPLVIVTAVNLKTVINQKQNTNEIASASVVCFHKAKIDTPTLTSEWTRSGMLSHFTVVRKLEDGLFPTGFSKEAADKNSKAGSNIITSERSDILVGHNISGFDLDVLLNRVKACKVPSSMWSKIGWLKRFEMPRLNKGNTVFGSGASPGIITFLSGEREILQQTVDLGQNNLNFEPTFMDLPPAIPAAYVDAYCQARNSCHLPLAIPQRIKCSTRQLLNSVISACAGSLSLIYDYWDSVFVPIIKLGIILILMKPL